MTIDESNSAFDRIDAERAPCIVKKRDCGLDVAVDVVAFEQIAHGSLEYEWRPGYRKKNFAMGVRFVDESICDRQVHLFEGVSRVVYVVERFGPTRGVNHQMCRRMSRRSNETSWRARDQIKRAGCDARRIARSRPTMTIRATLCRVVGHCTADFAVLQDPNCELTQTSELAR